MHKITFKKKKKPSLKENKDFEVYYMCRVIMSCKTGEQLENAYTWACEVINNWKEWDERIVKTERKYKDLRYMWLRTCVYDKYNTYYFAIGNAVKMTLDDINNSRIDSRLQGYKE